MVVVVMWACDVEMALMETNVVWSTTMAQYRNIPQNCCTYSVDCASTKSPLSMSAYWVLEQCVGWFHWCRESWCFVVALLWNLRRSACTYPGMEMFTFLLA